MSVHRLSCLHCISISSYSTNSVTLKSRTLRPDPRFTQCTDMNSHVPSSNTTSSRPTPSEEMDLCITQEVAETTQVPTIFSGSNAKEELRGRNNATIATVIATTYTPENTLGDKKNQQLQQKGRTLIAVVKKDCKESADLHSIAGIRSQILATARLEDTEFETSVTRHVERHPRATIPSIGPSINSKLSSHTAKDHASVKLDTLKPSLTNDFEDMMPFQHVATVTGTTSSDASIFSASLTPTSISAPRRRVLLKASQHNLQLHQQTQYSANTLSLQAEGLSSSTAFPDLDHFNLVFRELFRYTEQLEQLNEQILEAMTLHPSGSRPIFVLSPILTRMPTSPVEGRRRMKGKEKVVDLEENQLCIAQSFRDLVMDSWPRIYKIPSEPETAQLTRRRIKVANELKDTITAFWSVQTHFQERAQLILDVYQDPTELEHGNMIHILRSRHLNNLLTQEPLDPHEVHQLLEKNGQHQEKIDSLSEQLQDVWLSALMFLSDSEQRQSSKLGRRLGISSMYIHGAASASSSYYIDDHSSVEDQHGSLFHLCGRRLLELKVAAILVVGVGMIAMALVVNTR
ncbi:hypothetical protein BC939DRAFT_460767 [Gamsiella multidivaricata]|uniref:uncharacterized protein n=1 Tax=Gamsiella multidivaricata TaxID=101098 RepID=UPI00221F5E35|nr:uncharacterized protein BC939DRAFT_460767 [Gamsiella multidivaricata]KAI7819132.1 hypothetical protein BC939DRAFT_460767 [Gamsiella multidivaricata]